MKLPKWHRQFIVQSTLDRAGEILRMEEALHLSERDARAFLDALDNPPPQPMRLCRRCRRMAASLNAAAR